MKILYIDVAKVSHIVNGRKPFALGVVKPERHNLRLIVGGQTPKQYAPKIETNQSTSTPQTAA